MTKKKMVRVFRTLFFISLIFYFGVLVYSWNGYLLDVEFANGFRLKQILLIITIVLGVFFADFTRHDSQLKYVLVIIGTIALVGFVASMFIDDVVTDTISSNDHEVKVLCDENQHQCEFYVQINDFSSERIYVAINRDGSSRLLDYYIEGNDLVIIRTSSDGETSTRVAIE